MKRFPYKFTPLVKCLFSAVFIIAVAVIVINIIKFAKTTTLTSYSWVTLLSTVIVSVLAIVICISMLISSYFQVDDEKLTLRWGFYKNEILIKDITKLVRLQESNKLAVYYNDNFYYVVFIKPEYFDDFSSLLVEKNKNIVIEFA